MYIYICIHFLDEPPPAYEVTASSNVNTNNNHENVVVTTNVEAPPAYCLVDPSKIRNTDHIPHHPHITPVEIIDVNGNEQVNMNYIIYFLKNINLLYFFLHSQLVRIIILQ